MVENQFIDLKKLGNGKADRGMWDTERGWREGKRKRGAGGKNKKKCEMQSFQKYPLCEYFCKELLSYTCTKYICMPKTT